MFKLREEDIERPKHLVELSKKDVKSIAEALRKLGGLVLGSNPRSSMV